VKNHSSVDVEREDCELLGSTGDREGFKPNIVAFCCNWCSYAGADYAGVSRIQYPANVKIVRVMCSGRINPVHVLEALLDGADGVLIAGCHPGDCHYIRGNLFARRRYTELKKLLEAFGIDPRRIKLEWVSASEGEKFAHTIRDFVNLLKELGPNNVKRRM